MCEKEKVKVVVSPPDEILAYGVSKFDENTKLVAGDEVKCLTKEEWDFVKKAFDDFYKAQDILENAKRCER